jgi:23S rRNA-/tRNA-specific pseudouridylate synthase
MNTSASAIILGGAAALSVVWEDEYYFALAKPSGLHTLSADSTLDCGPSVSQLLCQTFPALAHIGGTAHNAGLLQRLDRETSGIVLGAKTDEAWARFRDLYSAGKVQKTYRVALDGLLHHPVQIDAAIGSPYRRASKVRVYDPKISRVERPEVARSSGPRSATGGRTHGLLGDQHSQHHSRQRGKGRAQPALTEFTPNIVNKVRGFTIALASTTTGRRHQVRAHAGALGHPLCGDTLYGSTRSLSAVMRDSPSRTSVPELRLGCGAAGALPMFLLHAEEVSFPHPFTGQLVSTSLSVQGALGWAQLAVEAAE